MRSEVSQEKDVANLFAVDFTYACLPSLIRSQERINDAKSERVFSIHTASLFPRYSTHFTGITFDMSRTIFPSAGGVYVVNVIGADKFAMRKKCEQTQLRDFASAERQKVLIFMR